MTELLFHQGLVGFVTELKPENDIKHSANETKLNLLAIFGYIQPSYTEFNRNKRIGIQTS